MARGRLISLWRRCNQLTAGLSAAARKREMTNQPIKVRTCQRTKSAPSTTAVVSKATVTVRITCEVEACAHPASGLGIGALGPADAIGGLAWDCVCGSDCMSLCVASSSLMPLAPTKLWGETLQPRRVGQQSRTSCVMLLGPTNRVCLPRLPLSTGCHLFTVMLLFALERPLTRPLQSVFSCYYSCAKASRSCFSCSSGRLVEMISKSYCLSSSITLSGAVAPLVRANSAELPGVTFSRTCVMKSSLIPTSAIEPVSAPMPAPIAAPRKGTKKISPNRKPQNAPPIAPAPPVLNSWRVVGFLLP